MFWSWLKTFIALVKQWVQQLSDWASPPQPAIVNILRREEIMADQWKYTFQLPAPGASDVAVRRLKVVQKDSEGTVLSDNEQDLAGGALTAEALLEEGSVVSVSLADIDNAGNQSPFSNELTFNVLDDVAPPQPGELAVLSKEEAPST